MPWSTNQAFKWWNVCSSIKLHLKGLKMFCMDKSHPFSFPMIVWSLETSKDLFWPLDSNEVVLSLEVSNLSVIDALIYLVNNTCFDIAFLVSLLVRYNSHSIRRYWNEIRHILHYLQGISDIELFYSNESSIELIGYIDERILSNLHKTRFQIHYLFTYDETTISWHSLK